MLVISPIIAIQYTQAEIDAFNFDEDVDKQKFIDFIKALEQDVIVLNTLIENLKNTTSNEGQLKILHLLYVHRLTMNNKYSRRHISICLPYQEQIHKRLWVQLKESFDKLGVGSLTRIKNPQIPVTQSSLTEIISNMSHEKLSQLMMICWDNEDLYENLVTLYLPGESGYTEFQKFLKTHSIQIISGEGNSRNIKIEASPPNGTPVMVLKVDARLSQPKEHEEYLRKQSSAYLANTHSEVRQATFWLDRRKTTADIFLTEYLPSGDLRSRGRRMHNAKRLPEEIITKSLYYFKQMATILLDMQSKGVAFPDAKNTNWLIDENDALKIADTKSFVSCNETTALIDYTAMKNKWTGLIYSRHLCPVEFDSADTTPFSADKMGAYILGKNLYQFLTSCSSEEINDEQATTPIVRKDSFQNGDFNHPIFQSIEGKKLKILIQKMVKPNPENRIPLTEALRELNLMSLMQECKALYKEIETQLPNHDELPKFIQMIGDAVAKEDGQKLLEIKNILQEELDLILDELKIYFRLLDDLLSECVTLYTDSTEILDKTTRDQFKSNFVAAHAKHDITEITRVKNEFKLLVTSLPKPAAHYKQTYQDLLNEQRTADERPKAGTRKMK